MPRLLSVSFLCLGVLGAFQCLDADTVTFTLTPSSNISGAAGTTIGWGFSVTNNSAVDYYQPTNLNAGSFADGTPQLLFDILGLDLAPGATATEMFDAGTGAGLYELTWDANAPAGFINSGAFTLSGSFFQGDPNSGGAFDFFAPDASVQYSATVGISGTPEPPPSKLLLLMLMAFPAIRRMRKAKRD